MVESDREIDFPFSVTGRAGIIGDHRRTALSEPGSGSARRNRRDR
jgi:hypothetical protein